MKRSFSSLLPIALLTFACAALIGQTTSASVTHAPDPDSGMVGHVDGIFIPLIPGQPFHARIAVQVTRQLPDGTMVAQKYYTLAARDETGRTYREARDIVPADSDKEPPLIRSIVYNPKTNLVTSCYPERRTCQNVNLQSSTNPPDEPVGPSSDGKSVLTRESLGTKTMDGLDVQGTRETTTYRPGAFGNDKPVVVTKEIWYSPLLQFNLSTTRIDPRNGTQKLEVADLKLGEPGAEWFAMPDGYRLMAQRVVNNAAMMGPTELAPLLQKNIAGMSADELATAVAPVEAAIGAYVKAHTAASPSDRNDVIAGQMRSRLSSDLQMMQQQNRMSQAAMLQQSDAQLNQLYKQVLASPCLAKTSPGDPPTMPSSEATLRAEQDAWVAVRDAWAAFLAKLYPNSDSGGFGFMLTSERTSDLRRMQNVERNRGCLPIETMEPLLEKAVVGMTPEQLTAALKPVDAALNAYVKAHADAVPNERNNNFAQIAEQNLANEVRTMGRNQIMSRDMLDQNLSQMNLMYGQVLASPCLAKTAPGDPPTMPVSEAALRDEQKAWVALKDAWTAFMTQLYPHSDKNGFGFQMVAMRSNDLRQMQNVERNRGCVPEESMEALLERQIPGMTPEQLSAALKPVNAALNAYAKAHAASSPNDRDQNFAQMTEQVMANDLRNLEQNQIPTQDQFEEADLHLNQAYRVVVASPCVSEPMPGDPPNASTSEANLRAEQRAWVQLRDAWTAFLATVFPNAPHKGFGAMLTDMRTGQIRQMQNVERNRGCKFDD